ncbi:P-loop containing nucleoside triphosphate hydrolase protein [Mycena leptocephala]|nr:P-loop containing nucleoside triphosphate hydrolase protein [Mycena leptocephala]
MPISRLRNCSRIDGGNTPIAAALGSEAIACDPQTFLNAAYHSRLHGLPLRPFQTMYRCLSCRGKADDDDFGSVKPPQLHNAPPPTNDVPVTRPLRHRRRAQHPRASFTRLLREGTPFVVDPEQEAAVWAKERGGLGRRRKAGRRRSKMKTTRSTHATSNCPSCCTTSRSPSRAARLPPSSGAWGGKSSLLKGVIGEMRPTDTGGKWAFGGTVVYCPWSAWIQNATVMDSVLFGQPFEEDRYWHVMEDSHLPPDLQPLADGDLTELTLLADGQKQRVNIARALSYGTDVVIVDDPLSAGNASLTFRIYINRSLTMATCSRRQHQRGALPQRDQGLVAQGKTVLLITHVLHFLAQCDYIYTLDGGRIAEAGTYPELIARGGELIASLGAQRLRMQTGRAAWGRRGRRRGAAIDNALPNDPHAMHHNVHANVYFVSRLQDLTEDPAIVAKRTELAQRMKMLEGVRKDVVAFEKLARPTRDPLGLL